MTRLLDRFTRKTSSGQYIPVIDGLRFISIGVVILFHLNLFVSKRSIAMPFTYASANSFVGWFASFGHYGVEMFFIISGFVLSLPFARFHLDGAKPVNIKQYFIRRVTRLEPPYILNLTVLLPFVILLQGYTFRELFPHYIVGLVYMHNLTYSSGNLINSVVWSLEVEFTFYILAPLLTWVFAIRYAWLRRIVLVTASLLFIAYNISIATVVRPIFLDQYIQYFFMGFLLADFYVTEKWQSPQGFRWDWVSVFGWIGLVALWNTHDVLLIDLLFPFTALLLYVAAFRGKLTNRLLSLKLITVIGGMCYTIYLYHYAIISAFGNFTTHFTLTKDYTVNYLLQLLLLLPLILGSAAIFFLLVERPCMDPHWPQKLKTKIVSYVHHI